MKAHQIKGEALENRSDMESIDAIQTAGARKVGEEMGILYSGTTVKLQLDAGAMFNILPLTLVPQGTDMSPSTTTLSSWTGNKVIPEGQIKIKVQNTCNQY